MMRFENCHLTPDEFEELLRRQAGPDHVANVEQKCFDYVGVASPSARHP